MEQFGYEEGIQADALLLSAREVLAEAQQVASGEWVRLTHYPAEGESFVHLLPYRVAAYARKMLGNSVDLAILGYGARLVFYSRGLTVEVLPTVEGYAAFLQCMVAHSNAQLRRYHRLRRQLAAKAKKGRQAA